MTKFSVLAVCLTALLAASGQGAYSQGGGRATSVSLRLTFESTMSDGTPCAVLGDGLGEYVDGTDGVTAYFSRAGNLQSGGGTSSRSVTVNYSEFYPSPNHPASVPPPPSGPHSFSELNTFNAFQPYTLLQDMRLGDAPQCLKAGLALDQASVVWLNNYHWTSLFFDPLDSYAIASCIEESDGKCTKWQIESAASDCASGTVPTLVNVAKMTTIRNKVTYQDYGLWKLPFRLTLTRNTP